VQSKSNAIREDKKKEEKIKKENIKEDNSQKFILFDSWWNLYAKKTGRDKAIEKWLKMK
jgi:hypothetical protein